MANRVDIQRKNNENPMGLLRKFTRRVRDAGFMKEVRARRYFKRKDSDLRRKESALDRMAKRKEYSRLYKLGRLE
jgi:ribosomal protein S21